MNEEEKIPQFPLPLSIEESVEKGDFEKAAQSARKIFDVWSHGPSLILAGDLWAKTGDLVRAKECYEMFLLRCGYDGVISDSVRSKLNSIKINKETSIKPPSKKPRISIPKKILATLRNLFHSITRKASEKYKVSVIPFHNYFSRNIKMDVTNDYLGYLHYDKPGNNLDEINGQYMGLIKITPAGWRNVKSLLGRLSAQERSQIDVTSLFKYML